MMTTPSLSTKVPPGTSAAVPSTTLSVTPFVMPSSTSTTPCTCHPITSRRTRPVALRESPDQFFS
uniref:Uncharacterized protein n=1 Tax=Rhizophora mucronata TaxID=61149 RepID=A0A2P2PCQ0_RHIMU